MDTLQRTEPHLAGVFTLPDEPELRDRPHGSANSMGALPSNIYMGYGPPRRAAGLRFFARDTELCEGVPAQIGCWVL
jgi:hypothetical protein